MQPALLMQHLVRRVGEGRGTSATWRIAAQPHSTSLGSLATLSGLGGLRFAERFPRGLSSTSMSRFPFDAMRPNGTGNIGVRHEYVGAQK